MTRLLARSFLVLIAMVLTEACDSDVLAQTFALRWESPPEFDHPFKGSDEELQALFSEPRMDHMDLTGDGRPELVLSFYQERVANELAVVDLSSDAKIVWMLTCETSESGTVHFIGFFRFWGEESDGRAALCAGDGLAVNRPDFGAGVVSSDTVFQLGSQSRFVGTWDLDHDGTTEIVVQDRPTGAIQVWGATPG